MKTTKDCNMLNRKCFCLLALGYMLVLSSQLAFGQCEGEAISNFQLVKANASDGKTQGQITVSISGGEAPFTYRLMGDRGGRGIVQLQESAPITARSYTFRNINPNYAEENIFYQVEVETSNQHQGSMPAAICRKRIIQNIELK